MKPPTAKRPAKGSGRGSAVPTLPRKKKPSGVGPRFTVSLHGDYAEEIRAYAAALGWTPARFCETAVGTILAMIAEPSLRVVPGVCRMLDALKAGKSFPVLDPMASPPPDESAESSAVIIPFPGRDWRNVS